MVATYRATPELRPAPRRRELPRATVVDRVPAALANEVRARQQADVSSVPVYRGQKVSEAARSRGARAFASGGAVFLPDEAGPVDSPKARGLLAHELTHAVQQRMFGPRLPAPETPIGRRLEAEAQAAERFYSGEAGAAEPLPLIHAQLPAPAPQPEPDLTAVAQLATELAPAPAPQTTPQPTHSPFDAVQTAEVGRIATDSAKHVVAEWTNPTLQKQNGAGGTPPAHPAAGGAQPGAGGPHTPAHAAGTPARGGAAFNAAARRDQLITQALTMRNAALLGGEAAVTELSDDEMAAINNQVAAEAAQHGVTVPSDEPPAQHYEPNSGKAWMHALTGMNMNYGLGLGGYNEKVGSENSWWGSETGDKRQVGERLADQIGLINENTETQFDTNTWWQDDKKDAAAASAGADQQQQQPQHEESLYGRPNPDRSTVDVSRLDLDDLATRLYDRLRTRLRTELLVDRERAGLLTDFR